MADNDAPQWTNEQKSYIKDRLEKEIVIAKNRRDFHAREMLVILGGIVSFCAHSGLITDADAESFVYRGKRAS